MDAFGLRATFLGGSPGDYGADELMWHTTTMAIAGSLVYDTRSKHGALALERPLLALLGTNKRYA